MQTYQVAIPIPSGEGQNGFDFQEFTLADESQYLYLLVKVRTIADAIEADSAEVESQYLYLLVKVRTKRRGNSSLRRDRSQYLYLLVKVRTFLFF